MRGENVVHWGGSWSLVCGRREMFERIWRAGKMGIAGASYAAHELYMAMRCIFCLEDRPPSDEHVFPLAIGGSLHTDRVCLECNPIVGKTADAPLCNHVLIVVRRAQLKLAGNSDTIPDGLKAFFGTGELVGDPTKRLQVRTNPQTGKLDLRMLYHATETQLGEGVKQRQIIIDAKDAGQLGTIIQRERKRAGFEPLSPADLRAQAETILAAGVQTIEKPELHHQIKIDLAEFRRGLLKIAYELAFIWLGESYLDDPMAAKLRDVILSRSDEKTTGLRGRMEIGSDIEPVRFWAQDKDCHVAYNAVLGNDIAVCLKIFDIFSAVIVVGEQKDRYVKGQFDEKAMRFIYLDPVSGINRQCSFIEEMGRLAAQAVRRSR